MATKKKMLQAAAGSAAGGGFTAIEDVFSTYLFDSSSSVSPVTVTNGIDLAGEGGMVWEKSRTDSGASPTENNISDTERGPGNRLITNRNLGNLVSATGNCSAFNSDGFAYNDGFGDSTNKVSWTFRKAPRFFDVVTYTGNGSGPPATQDIPHNLGSTPGCIIVKMTSGTENWAVFHRTQTNAARLNQDGGFDQTQYFDAANVTDTTFRVKGDFAVNQSGQTYVAYLFAHDPLGPSEDGSDGLIACGSFNTFAEIDLGFEPQWVMYKRSDGSGSWSIVDNMRGWVNSGNDKILFPNTSDAEADGQRGHPTASGMLPINGGSDTYIYIAIRRGPMRAPESGTEVFAVETKGTLGAPAYNSGFPVDMLLVRNNKNTTFSTQAWDRLRSTFSLTTSTAAEESFSSGYLEYFGQNDGFDVAGGPDSNDIAWMFRRAPNFFDVVAYGSNNTSSQTISHNLGVTPEMFIVKVRDTTSAWAVYHKDVGNTGVLRLNSVGGPLISVDYLNNTSPTETDFTVGTYLNGQVGHPTKYIAYLFATLAGVSKVGSYTGTGTSGGNINVDCGFTAGARFVMIKRTDAVGSWFVVDTARGIVTGNEPILTLNDAGEELTNYNMVEPYSAGFIVNGSGVGSSVSWNDAGGNYIFYAIA